MIAAYKLVLGQAELYYQVHKSNVNDLVIKQKKVIAFNNIKNAPSFQKKK